MKRKRSSELTIVDSSADSEAMKTLFQIAFIIGMLLLSVASVPATKTDPVLQALQQIDPNRMLADITELSSARYEGRQAGTLGGRRSADIVAGRMKKLGLLPAGPWKKGAAIPSWFQQESLPVPQLPNTALLEFSFLQGDQRIQNVIPELGKDFLPILDSPAVNITAPLVFVGYGIDDPARGVNDYDGIDVRNRIVMFLRGKPTHYPQFVTHAEKEKAAREKGAVGFITLTGPILNRYDARRGMGHAPLAMYSSDPDDRPLPGCWISGNLGERLFESRKLSLREVQNQLNEGHDLRSPDLEILAHLRWESTIQPGRLINVLGFIPGSDPVLRNETVIIGAHRDHFGKQAGLLFAGADDNASGTALLLEVARLLVTAKEGPKRSVLFVSFSGEERGLLGSKLYVRTPARPLERTVAMINIDHVGVGNGKLTVGVSQMPKGLANEATELAGLDNKVKLYGYFPGGDHVPFAKENVPTVAVVSSGTHPSFHQPSDTAETIQLNVLETAVRYVLALTWLFANPS
jgi:hypothetical protein